MHEIFCAWIILCMSQFDAIGRGRIVHGDLSGEIDVVQCYTKKTQQRFTYASYAITIHTT